MYNPIVNNYIYKKLLTFMVSKQYLTVQLIKCDMWKVITEINEKSPLKEGDLNNLNMEIRENSLYHVEMFIKRGDLHQQHDSSTT
jgi:hypothetical protein